MLDSYLYLMLINISLCDAGESEITSEATASNEKSIIDIDSKHKGPQMCSLYAAEVYGNLRAAEVWIAVDLPSLVNTSFVYDF